MIVSLLQGGEEYGDWPEEGSPVQLRDRDTHQRLWIDRETGRPIEQIDVERGVVPPTG